MNITNPEQLADRFRDLQNTAFNGIQRVFVSLENAPAPGYALLDLEFQNTAHLEAIANDINLDGIPATQFFQITGGSRINAQVQNNQLQVDQVLYDGVSTQLQLRINGVGDYSTYQLTLSRANTLDPLFSDIEFKFRPGCFNSDCAPLQRNKPPLDEPVIDYLTKDFQSFKHLLINAMQQRVPGWQATSEADLDQVMIDLLAADADELSDFQDRTLNEAWFVRARKRVSLARHARLMDYHIHQGNQASTFLAVIVQTDTVLPVGFSAWTGTQWEYPDAQRFVSTQSQSCYSVLNQLNLYTWGGVVSALDAGSYTADVIAETGNVTALRDRLRDNDITHLLIEEKLNPASGTENGRNKMARQRVRLITGDDVAQIRTDPITGDSYVRIQWQKEDKLTRRYCFITQCDNQPAIEGVSAFHGNLIPVSHGRPYITRFREPGSVLAATDSTPFIHFNEAHYETTPRGTLCRLPDPLLAYQDTPPGGVLAPRSTLTVNVSGFASPWQERIDFIDSESDDLHYMVETDEYDVSRIRFGNNINGRALPDNAVVSCQYQISRGSMGNIGADTLTGYDSSASGFPNVARIWNPLDVVNGRAPETRAEILRRVPQAYRAHQLRAITLQDYAQRAEEIESVAHASAHYVWTGSWRAVRIAIDPTGTTVLSPELQQQITRHLDAVRLIGEDLEVRVAQFVPLDIELALCAHPDFWLEDLDFELIQAFSDGYTGDGRRGFFHPDNWTFGQTLYASELIGRALSIQGIERVTRISIRRWFAGSGEGASVILINPEDIKRQQTNKFSVKEAEIIQLENNPDHLERGRIQFNLSGGRR